MIPSVFLSDPALGALVRKRVSYGTFAKALLDAAARELLPIHQRLFDATEAGDLGAIIEVRSDLCRLITGWMKN